MTVPLHHAESVCRTGPSGIRAAIQNLFPSRKLKEIWEAFRRSRNRLTTEEENERRMAALERQALMPSNLYVQVTNHCNLRCVMCGHKNAIKDNAFMTDALFTRVLDQASANRINNLYFASAFGETLLHPKGMEYLRESVTRGFQVTMSTNGNFLEADAIEELAGIGLHLIQYSFFGFDAPSYEKVYVGGKFEKATENLRLLKAALQRAGGRTKLQVNGINVVNDAERTRKTREFVSGLGIAEDEMRFSMPNNFAGRISPGTFAQRIGAKSFKSVDRLPLKICPQLLQTPGVMADGRFTACGCLDNNGSLAIGDIRSNTIPELRAGERYQSMIEAFRSGDLSKYPMCQKCDVPYGDSNELPA